MVSVLGQQLGVGDKDILTVASRLLNVLDRCTLRLDDHVEDAPLDTVTSIDQGLTRVANHYCGEKSVDQLHD